MIRGGLEADRGGGLAGTLVARPATAGERCNARLLWRTDGRLGTHDDRVGTRATLITSQLPVTAWHEWLDDPTLADAILDRLIHNAHRVMLKGPSKRKGEDTDQ